MSGITLSKPERPIQVGVILMDSTTEILDVAPVDIFEALNKRIVAQIPDFILSSEFKDQGLEFAFHWVSEKGPSSQIRLSSGLSITPTDSFETCPPLDICLMGAHHMEYKPSDGEFAFVRKAYDECSAFITICGGVEVPRLAGILNGKTATGPRPFLEHYRQVSPETNWLEKRWVRDGKLWTSGTLLNGTDLMHNLAKYYWGEKGDESLVNWMTKFAGWPDRDVDYKDVTWTF